MWDTVKRLCILGGGRDVVLRLREDEAAMGVMLLVSAALDGTPERVLVPVKDKARRALTILGWRIRDFFVMYIPP